MRATNWDEPAATSPGDIASAKAAFESAQHTSPEPVQPRWWQLVIAGYVWAIVGYVWVHSKRLRLTPELFDNYADARHYCDLQNRYEFEAIVLPANMAWLARPLLWLRGKGRKVTT